MGKRAVVGLGSIDRDVQNSAPAAALAAQPVPVETPNLIVSAPATEGTPILEPVIRLSSPSVPDTRIVTRYERFLKPVIDKVLASVLLVVLSPILAVVGVMVAKSLGRPIVLRQQRVGKDEERFVLHKFRT